MAINNYISSESIRKLSAPITVTPNMSGYTRISEFTFTVEATGSFATYFPSDLSQVKVVWDFGDGYTLSADTPYQSTHIYDHPGQYTVNLHMYDSSGETYLNTLTETVSVFNYKKTRVTLANGVSSKQIKAGVFDINSGNSTNKVEVAIQTTWQDYNPTGNTVYFTSSGSNSKPYDVNYKYSHLLPYWSFYNRIGSKVIRDNKTIALLEPQYYVLDSNNTPVLTSAEASGAKLLWAQGKADIYYFDDSPGEVNLVAALDTSNHKLPDFYVNQIETDINLSKLNFMESNVGLLNIRCNKVEPTKLILTSTGHRDMPLPGLKRLEKPFQIFFAAGDDNNNIFKYYPEFYLSASGFDNNDSNTFKAEMIGLTGDPANRSGYNLTSNISSVSTNKYPYNTSLSSTYLSSFGYINVTPVLSGQTTTVVRVSARPTLVNGLTSSPLTGEYAFRVESIQGPVEYKLGEDFDMSETIASYRFQEFMHDYGTLFRQLIGNITGNVTSDPNTYGKQIYEKIQNFNNNINDIDLCNLDVLKKFYKIFDDDPNFTITTAPPKVKRLFDTYTIQYKKLFGDFEKFGENFDTQFSSNSTLGVNIDFDNPITTTSYTVTAGTNFVARQKFGNKYILIEPMNVPTSTIEAGATTSQYPLSNYNICANSTWGWPLDSTANGSNLDTIYDFFPYVTNYTNTKENNVIDDTNALNEIRDVASLSANQQNFYLSVDKRLREGLTK